MKKEIEGNEQHSERDLDYSKIEWLDEKIMKEGRYADPAIRRAQIGDKQLILITPIHFTDGSGGFLTEEDFLESEAGNKWAEDSLKQIEAAMHGEERASLLADFLGVPMPTARYALIDGTPYVVSDFLEGAKDKGFGRDIEFIDDGREQALALAKGAVLKFLLAAHGDPGQYLQDKEGNLYLTDIGFLPQVKNGDDPLAELFDTGSSRSFFATSEEPLRRQLEALRSDELDELFDLLDEVTPEQLSDVIYGDQAHLGEVKLLHQRCGQVRRFFKTLTKDDETIEAVVGLMTDWYSQEVKSQRKAFYLNLIKDMGPSSKRN